MPRAATAICDKLSLGFADSKSRRVTDPLCDNAGGFPYHLRGCGLVWACASLPGIAVDLPCPHGGESWDAALGSTFLLLAQQVVVLHKWRWWILSP